MTAETRCVFCSIIAGTLPADVVFEDASHLAFFPLEHINPGHTLLIPKQHVDYLFDLPSPAYGALWATAGQIATSLRVVTGAKRIGVAVEGFTVPHAHIHLVPVNAGDELNPSRAKPVEPSELSRLAELLRARLGA